MGIPGTYQPTTYTDNPILLFMQDKTIDYGTKPNNSDMFAYQVWSYNDFSIINQNQVIYSPPQYITPLSKIQLNDYSSKEQEWIQLVGNEFANLPQDKKEFLLKTAGIFEFDQPIDIKKVYSTSIY